MRIIKRNKHYTLIGNSLLEKNRNKKNTNQQKIDWTLMSIISIPIFILIGFTYLASFLGEFGISYEMYFNINDCIKVLYIKSLLYYFLISIVVLFFTSLSLVIFIQMGKNSVRNKITIIKISLLIIIFLFCLYFLCNSKLLPLQYIGIIILSFIFIFAVWYYLGNVSTIIIIISAFTTFSYKIGIESAKNVKKEKLTYNIILKDGTQILKEGDTCKYLIYKTSENLFIYNEYIEQVEEYPISEIQKSSFDFKKN